MAIQRSKDGQPLTLGEAAALLGVEAKTLRSWMDGGAIRMEKLLEVSAKLRTDDFDWTALLREKGDLSVAARLYLVEYYAEVLGLSSGADDLAGQQVQVILSPKRPAPHGDASAAGGQ